MDKEPKNKKFSPEDYHDDSRPSLKMINFGLWLTENHRRLIKIFVALLIFSIIGMFVYSAYGFIYYFLVGQDQDKSLTENFSEMGVNLQEVHLRSTVIPLQASAPLSFSGDDKVDLAINLKNKNENNFASIDYCFVAGGVEFSCGTDFILPNTEKYLLALAQKEQSGRYEFVIKNTSWQRIDNRQYPDWPAYYAKTTNFVISNQVFSLVDGSNNLTFVIENKSPYSYWEVPLNIILTSGGSVVGVNRFVLSDLKSLEKRPVSISWKNGGLSGVQATISPDLNILDEAVYRR